mmetsp:Transcript_120746/g.276768  ORF Transcript_120746/g.276768 Transcript_120746/m.276768 type:complete len:229 (+) Transcript_120746:480-1166(+)
MPRWRSLGRRNRRTPQAWARGAAPDPSRHPKQPALAAPRPAGHWWSSNEPDLGAAVDLEAGLRSSSSAPLARVSPVPSSGAPRWMPEAPPPNHTTASPGIAAHRTTPHSHFPQPAAPIEIQPHWNAHVPQGARSPQQAGPAWSAAPWTEAPQPPQNPFLRRQPEASHSRPGSFPRASRPVRPTASGAPLALWIALRTARPRCGLLPRPHPQKSGSGLRGPPNSPGHLP